MSQAVPKTKPVVKAEQKQGKAKKTKDENAPKRPLSPFFNYQAAVRPTLKASNPGLSNTELVKALAEQWRNLTAEGKKPYEELTAKAKVEYDAKMKTYIAPTASAGPPAKAKSGAKPEKPTKPVKDVNAPKRPLTPFFHF